MSTPALKDSGQLSLVHPGIWLCPFQSPTTRPLNPISSLKILDRRYLFPCILVPFHELKLAITV